MRQRPPGHGGADVLGNRVQGRRRAGRKGRRGLSVRRGALRARQRRAGPQGAALRALNPHRSGAAGLVLEAPAPSTIRAPAGGFGSARTGPTAFG